jgi:hypothetical protein
MSPLILADEGVSQAVIVVSSEATAPEKHAARELADFLKQTTDAEFQIVDRYVENQTCLLVGGDAARWALPEFSTDALSPEELILRTVGKDVILAGGRPRGTLYAVYTFLEDIVGCRWWTPTVSTLPKIQRLKLDALDLRYTPAFEFREPYFGDAQDADWCVRNKLNGARTQVDAVRGGKYAEVGGVHSFYQYLPPEDYFEAHPEWFSECEGERTASQAQLCLTNAEMHAEFAERVKVDIRAHTPGATNLWVSQNDWDGHCQCQRCRELEEQEASPAGGIVHFVNAVATAIENEFPEVIINTLAYDWSQKPPRHIKPHPNVAIWLCTTGCSYAHPITHERNAVFDENLRAWAQICDRIYIWDYVTNFSAYLCPHPNLRTLAPNVQHFAQNRVKGVFSLGAYGAPGAEMSALRAWVIAKLLWEPNCDGAALISEFLSGYFGSAAPYMEVYLAVFHDAVEATGEDLYMQQQPTRSRFLTLETATAGMAHLQAAKTAVKDSDDLSRRVEVAELPLLYLFLTRWDELRDKANATGTTWPLEGEMRPVYDRLLAVMAENGITLFSERNARDWFPYVRECMSVGTVAPPPGCEGLATNQWADLQNIGFNVRTGVDNRALAEKAVEDMTASNGSAAWMPADHEQKALIRELWRVPMVTIAKDAGRRLRCYLSVRCELSGDEGVVFRCGVDGLSPELTVMARDIPDNRYHTYELGVFENLMGWKTLWLAPGNNPDNVKGIFVDRIWLVQEE